MNISFAEVDKMSSSSFINVQGNTTSNSASSKAMKAEGSAYSLDISTKVTDNTAYKGHGKTAKDVMMSAESMDIDAQRNYMVVMSNCVSDEDLAKMQQEGFDPASTDFEEVVTIVDHIKAAVAQGGTSVVGYTDQISDEALVEITGSKANAEALRTALLNNDVPVNSENAKQIQEGYEELNSLNPLSEAGVKYLIENDLDLSVNNLYTATYSSGTDANVQGRGYYAAGEVAGYMARKPETIDIEALLPQIEGIIKDAGYTVSEGSIEGAKWLIEKGIPLTTESLKQLGNINSLVLPMEYENFADHAAFALSERIPVKEIDLTKPTGLMKKAIAINDEVQTLGTIKGRRVLEEVRLSMTVEANLKLLRSGYAIDTAPMEELVKNLKEVEKEYAINLTNDEDEIEAVRKKNIYDVTLDLVNSVAHGPISISLSYSKEETFEEVGIKAKELTFAKAGEAYEALMTAPRADLGDSYQKAFNNVDDILTNMNLAITSENERAVRILGYNSMEITPEAIESVKDKDKLLTSTIEKMTPGKVLSMIRENVNPLLMSIDDLSKYFDKQDTTKEDMMSYGKFLYKLEKDQSITEDERSAFIGIYRLVHAIEKSDFSSIGAIETLGTEFNFENMLSALRSRKHKAMDYKVDDKFGGVTVLDKGIESITTQIARGFISDTDDLKKVLENIGDRKAEEEYQKEEFENIRKTFDTEKEVLQALEQMNTPVSASNIESMHEMMETPNTVFKKLREAGYRKNMEIKLESKKETDDSFEEFVGSVKDFLENQVFGKTEDIEALRAMDIRMFADMYRQMDFLGRQAKEENYEIPAMISDELIAINLKVISKEDESNVSISFDSAAFGHVKAVINPSNHGWEGLVDCENKDDAKILDFGEFKGTLNSTGITDKDVVSTDELYKAAKAFIEYVQKKAA